jgi:hypothetical protein
LIWVICPCSTSLYQSLSLPSWRYTRSYSEYSSEVRGDMASWWACYSGATNWMLIPPLCFITRCRAVRPLETGYKRLIGFRWILQSQSLPSQYVLFCCSQAICSYDTAFNPSLEIPACCRMAPAPRLRPSTWQAKLSDYRDGGELD